jgi:hypothetical protein
VNDQATKFVCQTKKADAVDQRRLLVSRVVSPHRSQTRSIAVPARILRSLHPRGHRPNRRAGSSQPSWSSQPLSWSSQRALLPRSSPIDGMTQKGREARVLLPVVAVGALLVASRNIVIHEGHSDYNTIRARELSATAARASRVHNSASVSDVVLEAYVLSNGGEKLASFRETNVGMNESVVAWWPATDGSSASTMKRWAALTKTPLFDPSSRPLPPGKIEDKGDGSPHSVGVHLSHWHLAKTLAFRLRGHGNATRPSALPTVRIK